MQALVGNLFLCLAVSALGSLGPNLQNLTDLARDHPDIVMQEIHASPLRAVVPVLAEPSQAEGAGAALPTVTAHGMGDSCYEPGFASVTRGIGKRTGSYARCIPTGNNIVTDTINGFLLNMDKSVEVFAEKIRADPKLAGGFNAIGFSQGNSLIRGYIQKYNDPPVNAFISVHGTVMGVAAFPSCFQQQKPLGLICKALAEVLGDLAYLKVAQSILFQADYFRDPEKVTGKAYLDNSQLAQWNNENPSRVNITFNANFAKTQKFAMVRALKDSMVYPNEGEHWGGMEAGTYRKVGVPMNQTELYKKDLFGLRTANEAGKIVFETTPGDHLQFTDAQLYGWVDHYFLGKVGSSNIIV